MQQHVDTLQNIVDISEKQMVGRRCSQAKIISLTITVDFQRSQSLSGLSLTRTGSYLGGGEGGLESPKYSTLGRGAKFAKQSIINN